MFVLDIYSIVIAVLVSIILGVMWYSPLMFGKDWMKLSGITNDHLKKAKAKGMSHLYTLNFLMSLAQIFIIYTLFITGFELLGIYAIWIGFSMPVYASPVLWEGKSWKLFFINAGFSLVSIGFVYQVFRIFLLA